MIDIHNFARWNGNIIGQSGPSGPSDDDFVSLWQQLATHYAGEIKVMFGIMNEPHDLDITKWAATCQKVVNAIRGTGATGQLILLPGTNFDNAALLVSSGSADALMAIKNPDGTTNGLVLDIHKYLDVDNSGEHGDCVTDNIGNFSVVADYLRKVGRVGIVSETGAGTSQSVSDLHPWK
jgi:endoglucanase